MKELKRFIAFLNKIHIENDFCAFYSLEGHVNWFEWSIRNSRKDYTTVLIEGIMHLELFDNNNSSKEFIDQEIQRATKVMNNRKEKLAQLKKEREEKERETYLKLKAKYE